MRSIRDILDTYDYDSKTGFVTEKQTGKQITDENELLELKTAFYYKHRIDETEKENRRFTSGRTGANPEKVVKRLDEFYSRQFNRNPGSLKNYYIDDFTQCEDLATASLRYHLRRSGKDARNIQLIKHSGSTKDIEELDSGGDIVKFDVIDYERVKEEEKKMDSKLDKLKSYQPENVSKGEYINLEPEQSARRMQFVEDLISTYDGTESQYDYKQRRDSHMLDSGIVVKAIKDNNFKGDITQGISGYIDYDDQGNKVTCYTIPEIKKITQMLKAAKTMSEKTGENYLEAFLNQPDVDKILKGMKRDRNGALRSLRNQVIQNRNANTLPTYPNVSCRDYDRIIDHQLPETDEKEPPAGRSSLGLRQPPNKYVQQSQTKASKFYPKDIPEKEVKTSHLKKFAEEVRNRRQIIQTGGKIVQPEQDAQETKKSDKFKSGYMSEARKKLLDNKKQSLDLQQQTCTFMVMADEEKDKKIQQPTKSRGMGR